MPGKYGFSDAKWADLKEEVRQILVNAAQDREVMTYSELCEKLSAYVFPGSWRLTALLSEVCGEEWDAGNGRLCALVVSKATGIPGAGFFKGSFHLDGSDISDPEAFWKAEVEQVFALWAQKD
ncbi:MAG: hypothetical protein H7175_11865 [Burkholderiales bacterium]|nr:hypothetical protein [Anaerolineae bacterium]